VIAVYFAPKLILVFHSCGWI